MAPLSKYIQLANATIDTVLISRGKLLKLTKTQNKDSVLYECIERNGAHEVLRKIIQVKVRGKYFT